MTTSLNAAKVAGAGVASVILTIGLARFAYTPLLPVMQSQAHLSELAGGWLATVNYLGYMAGTLIAALATRPGARLPLYRAALLMAIVTTAATGLTDNVYLWAGLRFAAGLSSAGGMLISTGLVLNWLARQGRHPELGLHFSGMGIGIALSGAAVLLMGGRLDWSQQWLALGALGLVLLLPSWAWMPAAAPAPHQVAALRHQAPSAAWTRILTAAYFCAGYGYVVSATFIVAMVGKLPALAQRGSLVWIVVGVAAAPACFGWDRVARKLGDTPALLLAFVVQTLAILLPCVAHGAGAWIASAALYGATFVGIVSLTLALAGRRFPDHPARAMARLTLGYGAAQVIAPALSAYLTKLTGSYQGALLVTAAVMTAGTALVLALVLADAGRSSSRSRANPAAPAVALGRGQVGE
jgi:MFS family permease